MEEDDGAPPRRPSPSTPKKIKMESEEPKELVKAEDQSEEESKEIEDDDEVEGEPPPLLDMIDLPPSSPLPPTPPLPSSPRDLNMEQQDSEDEGPPPGWDNKFQIKEVEQLVTPAAILAISSDIKTEDMQQDAQNENSLGPRAVRSDIKVEQEDSEDEGPPPGWDFKCHPEPELQTACPTTPRSDIKTEDVQQETLNEDGSQPRAQGHPSPAPERIRSDIKVEQDDPEDDGPPPGWDSKCQPEPELQTARPTTPRSDFKTENGQQDEEGPPPGWGSTPQQVSQAHSTQPSPPVPSGARMGCEQKNVKVVEERFQSSPKQQSIPPTKPQISVPKPPTVNNPEMGQMVCGSCRRLLSYPRGARYVDCACCLEENYVLEEHEVGQVVCGGCNALLMYPYGAPKVRCVNCSTETDIGDQNRRLPLSEHQRRAKRHLKRMQSG